MRLTTLAIFASLTGCVVLPTTNGEDSPDPSHPSGPAPVASGTYHVESRIDITVDALLPQPAEDMVVAARSFSQNPAHTMIELADAAGVPAVGTLRDVLPSYVMGKLEGWMNDEINKLTLGGVPVTQIAAEIAALGETSLTDASVTSTLEINGTSATHRLTAIEVVGTTIPLGAFPSDIVGATTSATSSNGTLTLGDHRFGLAYGEYAWQALEAACTKEYGAGLRATLGTAVDCPSLASKVANKCVLGVCVGHTAELTSICEAGLDEVVTYMHDQFADLRFDAVHFAAGSATIGTTGLTNGVWTAEINAGQGLRHVPATFSATH